ncbi:MAG: glycoside hydrolase family 65 protein [Bacteroidetes bacterium]|nr:glycoside hydrolase family 65 protein [Bacteroidota bacterium]
MKRYLQIDPWKIIEEGFHPGYNRVSESVFSTGNGKFGQRGNFEETFSGESLQGSYVAGVYYPDKTRVGWWKNGYPEYFAKVLNAPNWIGMQVWVNGEELDLAKIKEVHSFRRALDMQHGVFSREMEVSFQNGIRCRIETNRFCNLAETDSQLVSYKLTVVNSDALVVMVPFIDGKVLNSDSNYENRFWKQGVTDTRGDDLLLIATTKKTGFDVGIASNLEVVANNQRLLPKDQHSRKKFVSNRYSAKLTIGGTMELTRKNIIVSSLDVPRAQMEVHLRSRLSQLKPIPFAHLLEKHETAWRKKWEESDIVIEGDVEAQQGIRFNIFQLNCTYNGEDQRLNIGPKGFTGEKYGGSTYWDTEAYCLPFYQATADEHVAKNLLIYRYKHLQKAIENARMLGFKNGAALYPMVTMNGEECHNEWEITFEEIHRNGAIAYAIFDYIRYTGDSDYLASHGLEVLIGISRFWRQRVNWSEDKQQFVMLGVTGPNEFENNVNNNWYTNRLAVWCMKYTMQSVEWVKNIHPTDWKRIVANTGYKPEEALSWKEVVDKMYFPFSEKHNVFLQQDGFLDKELIPVAQLPESERPIVEHWSWDRILRSCYIKQADVLQGFYFFEDEFDEDTLRRHYDFYEPLTVHESSLSPCVHSILAAKLGDHRRAYEFYLRTARLDLDDYNNDTCDGLHITSMAGTWMSIVKGFAGMRVIDNHLSFKPFLPESWKSFSFHIRFRGEIMEIQVDKKGLTINGEPMAVSG